LKIAVVNGCFVPEPSFFVRQRRVDRGTDEFAKLIVGESAELLDPLTAEVNAEFWGYVEHKRALYTLKNQFFILLVEQKTN